MFFTRSRRTFSPSSRPCSNYPHTRPSRHAFSHPPLNHDPTATQPLRNHHTTLQPRLNHPSCRVQERFRHNHYSTSTQRRGRRRMQPRALRIVVSYLSHTTLARTIGRWSTLSTCLSLHRQDQHYDSSVILAHPEHDMPIDGRTTNPRISSFSLIHNLYP